MKVGVIVTSAIAETTNEEYEGELLISDDECKLIWTVPASPDESCPSVFTLQYYPSLHRIKLQRTGDYVLRLAFSDASTMPGDLTTPNGSFELAVATKKLHISDKLLCPLGKGAFLENAVDVTYLLDFGGGEIQANQLSIHVKLALSEE